MKRWLAVLLALVMVLSLFTLTACGEKDTDKQGEGQEQTDGNGDAGDAGNAGDEKEPVKTTYETVEEAAKKTGELKAVDATIKGELKAAANGEEMGYTAELAIKGATKEDKPVVGGTLKLAMMGEEVAMEAYYEDGYAYLVMDGQGVKVALPLDELTGATDSLEKPEGLPEFDLKALLNKSTITKGADGKSIVKIALELKDVQATVDALIAEIEKMTESELGAKLTAKQFDVELALVDGYLAGVTLKAQVEADVEGEVGTITLNLDIALNNLGQDVTITPPAGYETFEEAEMGL